MVRENSVLADFIGFSSSGDPSCRHENSAHDGGLAVSKPGSFREAQSGCVDANSCVTTAARQQSIAEAPRWFKLSPKIRPPDICYEIELRSTETLSMTG